MSTDFKKDAVSPFRQEFITLEARSLLIDLWKCESDERWKICEFIRDAPELIAAKFLGVKVETVLGLSYAPSANRLPQPIGGYVSRDKNLIRISGDEPPSRRRFTLAHEIGHWILHPEQECFRDSAISKLNHSDPKRPLIEREADKFAAELLMPFKTVDEEFAARFGDLSESVIYAWEFWENLTKSEQYYTKDVFLRSPFKRAMLISGLGSYQRDVFMPLCEVFAVSKSAMARRLLELRLVR